MKFRKLGVTVFIMIMAVFLVVCTGCADKQEKGTKYLNNKYGQEFIPLSSGMENYVNNDKKITYCTKDMIPEYECVSVYVDKGIFRTKFHDNYFGYIVRDKVEQNVKDIISDSFSQYMVINPVNDEAMPDSLTAKSKLKDLYKADPDYTMHIIVFVKAEKGLKEADYVDKVGKIEYKLHKTGHKYNLQLFAVNGEHYDKINRYDYSEFWTYYAKHNKPDHEVYEYVFDKVIK